MGRFVFGIGGDSLEVACMTYASSWFKGKALNMAFGFQVAVIRIGSAASFQMLSPIYQSFLSDECIHALPSFTHKYINGTHKMLKNLTLYSNITTSRSLNCTQKENVALGLTILVASTSVILDLVGSLVLGALDRRRENVCLKPLSIKEQEKVISKLSSYSTNFNLLNS